MANGVWSLLPNRTGCGAPQLTGLIILQIHHLAGRITHRIVVPGREPEEVAVLGPGARAAALGDDEPAVPVSDDIGPRRRRHPVSRDQDLVVQVSGKCSETVGVGGAAGPLAQTDPRRP